jgi:hypothetical protein
MRFETFVGSRKAGLQRVAAIRVPFAPFPRRKGISPGRVDPDYWGLRRY